MGNPMLRLIPETGVIVPIDIQEGDELYYDVVNNEIVKVVRDGITIFVKGDVVIHTDVCKCPVPAPYIDRTNVCGLCCGRIMKDVLNA